MPRLSRLAMLGAGILPFLMLASPFVLARFYPQPCPELLLDVLVTKDRTAEADAIRVWANDSSDFLSQDSVPGSRRVYAFKLTCQCLRSLQIMVVNGRDVELYEARVVYQGETVKRFGPEDLATWQTNCDSVAVRDNALSLRAPPTGHPLLRARIPKLKIWDLGINPLTHLSYWLFRDTGWPHRVRLLAFLLVAVCVLGLRGGARLPFLLVAASVPITFGVVALIMAFGGKPPAPDQAIGFACFFGYATSLRPFEVAALVCVPGGLALLLGWWMSRKSPEAATLPAVGRISNPSYAETALPPAQRRATNAVLALVTAVLACYFVPNLAGVPASLTSSLSLHWDSGNFVSWWYLIQNGAKPLSDFWYPYSGMALFSLPFPYGELWHSAHRFLVFAVFLWSVYFNSRSSLAVTMAIFLPVFALVMGGLMPDRYILIVSAILAYLAIGRTVFPNRPDGLGKPSYQWLRYALFWLAVVHAGVLEPTSLLYVGVPLLVSCGLDAVSEGASFWRQLPLRLCREFAVPVAGLGAVALLLAVQGQLNAYLEFMSTLKVVASYAAFPIELGSWLHHPLLPESFLLWGVVFLTAVGVLGLWDESPANRKAARVVLLLGLAADLVLLKQFVRPHMAGQIIFIPIVGILFYLLSWSRFNMWQKSGAFFGAGLLCAGSLSAAGAWQILEGAYNGPARALSSLPFLGIDEHERNELVARRFAPARFKLSAGHQAVCGALTQVFQSEGKQPIFVLSDDPIFYLLAGLRPYYHTNFYNASPLREQQRMVRLLQAEPPRLVVWNAADRGVDGVPPVVRVPLVYDYVIRNYVPQATHEQFELLRPRAPDEPVAIDFWRAKLGSVLHLGHIPRFSSLAGIEESPAVQGGDMAETLSVRILDVAALKDAPTLPLYGGYQTAGRSLGIPVECAGRRFTIVLQVVSGQAEYNVLLDRVWFWGPLRQAGLSPTLGTVPAGVEVRVVRRAVRSGILY